MRCAPDGGLSDLGELGKLHHLALFARFYVLEEFGPRSSAKSFFIMPPAMDDTAGTCLVNSSLSGSDACHFQAFRRLT
jgi:hypothetical protein